MKRTNGFILVEAHGVFEAVCAAHACLIDLGEFAIERISPALAQCWRNGRYDWSALEFVGEWRVPVTVRTDDDGTIPDAVYAMLNAIGAFLDLRVYPERAADDSGERNGDWAGEQPQHWQAVGAGSADRGQGGGAHPALLADAR
jgi:hypothetical protein